MALPYNPHNSICSFRFPLGRYAAQRHPAGHCYRHSCNGCCSPRCFPAAFSVPNGTIPLRSAAHRTQILPCGKRLLLAAGNIFVRKYPAAAGAFRWLLVLYGLLILIHFLIWLLAVFIQSLIIHIAKPPCFRLSQAPHPDSCCSYLITVFIISAIYEDK